MVARTLAIDAALVLGAVVTIVIGYKFTQAPAEAPISRVCFDAHGREVTYVERTPLPNMSDKAVCRLRS
jgi:hypothetical protein